jgi:hypothetical protein
MSRGVKDNFIKSSVFIFLFFVCCGFHDRNENLNLCRWHFTDKIEASDYQLIKKTKLYCFLSNDNENFYINIRIEDQGVQNRILKEGLTIWINMDGKEVKKMGVRFPVGSQNQGGHRKADHSENNALSDGSTENPLYLANTIELIGFISEQERRFPSENTDNFRGSVKYNEAGIFFYKMVMPIAKLPIRNSKEGHGAMPFTIGIEYGSVPVINTQGRNSGPAPSFLNRSGGSGDGVSELNWINNVRLATPK